MGKREDPALVFAEPVVRKQLGFSLGGQPIRVLDHVAIHVHDPQRAIGSGARHHGAAPAVFAGEKLARFLARRAVRGEAHARIVDDIVLHEIVERLAREGV